MQKIEQLLAKPYNLERFDYIKAEIEKDQLTNKKSPEAYYIASGVSRP